MQLWERNKTFGIINHIRIKIISIQYNTVITGSVDFHYRRVQEIKPARENMVANDPVIIPYKVLNIRVIPIYNI